MTADRPNVRTIAELARLDLASDEALELERQFERILAHFQALAEVDVSEIDAGEPALLRPDVLRDDEPRPSLARDALLAHAPRASDGFYAVPKTVGGEG